MRSRAKRETRMIGIREKRRQDVIDRRERKAKKEKRTEKEEGVYSRESMS